ncbi:hypothetical protein COMNV_00992 [Commensalibacter sp. Nvir]|uniref:N-acetylmuramoyl-L-alanine amidase family protein n=1 Tax=Commensalibacter sp. Nvir TaxID=3069817 RepID=UPI002D6B318E|nr:hypothetical protein COMNV_00992 [Commensalibacter sp. Nvir]
MEFEKDKSTAAVDHSKRVTMVILILWFFPVLCLAKSKKNQLTYTNKSKNKASKLFVKKDNKSGFPAIVGKAKPLLPLIVLDPGHGGKDPGAIGYSGTYEKHISYAVSLELLKQLTHTGRYRVKLTREIDQFIPLDGRVEFAQKHKANLFISLHADALGNHSVRGASVYTLSNHASDSLSAALATTENSADRYAGPNVKVVSPAVQKILASLVQLETKKESMTLAKTVVRSFNNRVGLLNNPRRHAGFVVLKSCDVPSILVEMGFMSNRMDESQLRKAMYQGLVASSLKNAINHYFDIGGSITHLTG